MGNELISIVVAAYNVDKYISKCLKSILNQTYTNLEVIVVNDGSKDDTENKIFEISNKDKRVVYLKQVNQGVSMARNNGIDHANGKYLMFVDGDDTINPKMIEKLYHALIFNHADIAQCNYINNCHNFKVFNSYLKKHNYQRNEILEKIIENKTIQNFSWGRLYKTDLFNHVRFPKGKRFEDIYTIFKAFEHATLVSTISYYGYNYSIRKGSYTNKMNISKILDMKDAFDYQKNYLLSKYPIIASDWNEYVWNFMALYSLLRDKDEEGFNKVSRIILQDKKFNVNPFYTFVNQALKRMIKIKYKYKQDKKISVTD